MDHSAQRMMKIPLLRTRCHLPSTRLRHARLYRLTKALFAALLAVPRTAAAEHSMLLHLDRSTVVLGCNIHLVVEDTLLPVAAAEDIAVAVEGNNPEARL